MEKITKRLIDSTECPEKGQVFLMDSDIPGFAVRLTNGSKSFILEKRIHGPMRRLTIGPFGSLTVEDARKTANKLVGRIANGENPAKDRIDLRGELTFKELSDLYKTRHLPRKKTAKNDEAMINNYLEPFHTCKLSSITRAEVARLHGKIGQKTPYASNRMLALVRKMFNLAKIWGVYEGENPCIGIERFKEEKRDRFIQPNELPKLFEAFDQESDPYIKSAFLISLFTGARRKEVLSMKWEHLDLDQGIWRIPDTKAGRPHLIPLPARILEVLSGLPRMKDNPHVFPGHGKKGHLVNVSKAWARVRVRAKLDNIRFHDLRRTLGSWLAVGGASLPLIGKVLNHTQPSTTAIYARLHLDPIREALEVNAQKMIEAGEVKNETR